MEKASSDDLQDSQLPEDVGVDYSAADQDELLVRRQPFWKKIGGDGLVVSIVIHVVLLILFGAWVVSSLFSFLPTWEVAWCFKVLALLRRISGMDRGCSFHRSARRPEVEA